MNSNLKIETIVPAVYLCYGAKDARSHRLTFVGQADSPWVGQSVSLNALGTFPVSTAPAIGLYQPFPLDGGEWTISCPDDGEPVSFAGQLQSEFTAAPYPISFELGHYLREFLGRRNPIGAPLIGDEVTAEAQVVSAYTQKLLKDVEVQWFVGGKPAGRIDTNDSGWSKFSYTFTTVGEQSITAKVFNPYDGTTVEHSFPIKVYAESPWKQADLKVNGVPVTWRSPVLLRRGQANEVTVKVESAIAKTLRLALINEEGLNIVAVPADTVWQQPDPVSGEFKWTLTSNEQKSGRVRLVIYSQEVAQPWEHDGRVLAGNLADEVEVRIDGKPVTSGVNFFFRGRPGVITLVSKEGSSVTEGLAVTLTRVITSGLDEADLVSSPGFGVPTPDHRWSVTGSNKSGTFQLIFTCQGIAVPLTVALNALLSTDLNDEAEVRIGGVEIPAEGQLFFRGEAQALTVVAKPGSPLGRLPLALRWIKGVGPEEFTCVPALGIYTEGRSWSITGPADKSGTFQFELVGEGMSTPIALPECILLSNNLADEADIKIDGQSVADGGVVFLRKRPRKVKLVAKSTSPIDKLPLMMKCEIVSGIPPGTIKSTPAFGSETLSREWEVGCVSSGEGLFRLEVSYPLQSGSLYIDCRQIDIWYTVDGQSIELVDGVGSVITRKWAPIFVARFSDSAAERVVEVTGNGMLWVKPELPLTFPVRPSNPLRLDVTGNYTVGGGSSRFTFKFADVNDYADVIEIRVYRD